MKPTRELINDLSEPQTIEAAKELFNIIYSQVPYSKVSDNAKGNSEVRELVSINQGTLAQVMPRDESTHFCRLILETFSSQPELKPFVRQAVHTVQSSDDLIIGELIALGLIVNLTLFVATTTVTAAKDSNGTITWKIAKGRAAPDLVKAVIEPLVKAATNLG